MREQITLQGVAMHGFVGSRIKAMPLREQAENLLANTAEIVLDFSGVDATQSFVDELVGGLVLRHGPDILERLIFKGCSLDVKAIIQFVADDRCDQYIKTHSH